MTFLNFLKPRRDIASNIIQVIKDTKRGAWVTPEIAREMLKHQRYLCEDCEKTVKIAKQNGLPVWVRWHDIDFHVHYRPEQEEWDSWSQAVQEKLWKVAQEKFRTSNGDER